MRPPRGGGGFRGGRDGGRFGGSGRGGGRGGGSRGGRGGGGFRDEGPPAEVVEVSTFLHACEGDAVTKLAKEKIPFFNAPIYLQNRTQIGKVDEIFGPINESYFLIKMMKGIAATSYNQGGKFYIDPSKLLPLARFLPQPKPKGRTQGGCPMDEKADQVRRGNVGIPSEHLELSEDLPKESGATISSQEGPIVH